MEPSLAAFVGRVDAAIPDNHFARAVLPGWNHALERGIVIRVILDVHGEPLFTRIERRTLGNRPGLEDAFAFEPEVIVQLPGCMLLDDEQQRPASRGRASWYKAKPISNRPREQIISQACCGADVTVSGSSPLRQQARSVIGLGNGCGARAKPIRRTFTFTVARRFLCRMHRRTLPSI